MARLVSSRHTTSNPAFKNAVSRLSAKQFPPSNPLMTLVSTVSSIYGTDQREVMASVPGDRAYSVRKHILIMIGFSHHYLDWPRVVAKLNGHPTEISEALIGSGAIKYLPQQNSVSAA